MWRFGVFPPTKGRSSEAYGRLFVLIACICCCLLYALCRKMLQVLQYKKKCGALEAEMESLRSQAVVRERVDWLMHTLHSIYPVVMFVSSS